MTNQARTDSYNFGGLGFVVRSSPEIAATLNGRLRLLECPPSDSCGLSFDFEVVAGPGDHRIGQLPGRARPFYETPLGEALYFEAEDQLYMNCGGRIRVLCRPQQGTV